MSVVARGGRAAVELSKILGHLSLAACHVTATRGHLSQQVKPVRS